MRLRSHVLLLVMGLPIPGCQHDPRCEGSDDDSGENVVIIIGDDVGIDKISAYSDVYSGPGTPNIDALAAQGLLFRNAYVSPTCSPTRASLLTGRMPSRTGIGRFIEANEGTADLRLEELSLAEMLRHSPSCVTTAWLGKWHMVSFDRKHAARHPQSQGFDHQSGSLANPQDAMGVGHYPRGHQRWEKTIDGNREWSDTYMATDTTDDALDFMRTHEQPWLAVVAYNLAHVPLHVPPGELNVTGVSEDGTDVEKLDAMVGALDAEIGRLIAGIPEDVRARTTVVYLSDNGTDPRYIESPWNTSRGKGSIHEGGVRVPFIVTGPHVSTPGAETDALAHVVDLFPTIAEISGVDVTTLTVEEGEDAGAPIVLDGVSLLPIFENPDGASVREFVYTEGFYPNGGVPTEWHQSMIRDADWKLEVKEEQNFVVEERLYHLVKGARDEGTPISPEVWGVDDLLAYSRLQNQLDELTAELSYGH